MPHELCQLASAGGIGLGAHASFKGLNACTDILASDEPPAPTKRRDQASLLGGAKVVDLGIINEGEQQIGSIRVLVVDDHDLFRTGLATLLGSQPDIEVVAQASGGRMGVRLAAELRPDVVLMDLRMPDLEGPEATREILRLNPATRIVALTVVTEDSAVTAALEAGACGFLAKDTPIDSVAVAVRAAAQGAAWLSPLAAEVLLGRLRQPRVVEGLGPDPSAALSPRELDVLRLIAQGMENSEIAEELQISPRTAKNHVSNILAKLGLPSRVQAAIYAVRRGLA